MKNYELNINSRNIEEGGQQSPADTDIYSTRPQTTRRNDNKKVPDSF